MSEKDVAQPPVSDLSKMRKEYGAVSPEAERFNPNPIVEFRHWITTAAGAGVGEPNAMALATCTPDGVPSVRFVLLKDLSDQGFSFFTNYSSRKANELAGNPNASAAFYWEPLERQVRISGSVQKLSAEESDEYFATRPRGAQIAASISIQSARLEDRAALELAYAAFEHAHPEGSAPIKRPEHWGGFRLQPRTIEFWQGSANRLHLRVAYTRDELETGAPTWSKSELFP